jgi:hypothetical protein
MSLRAYLTIMGFGTVVAAATFFLVLFRVDPDAAGALDFVLFYASLFLLIAGLVSISGFLARVYMHRDEILSRLVGLSFRQAILLSAVAVGALGLHSRGLLSWWNSLILVVAVTVAEFIFISFDKRPA